MGLTIGLTERFPLTSLASIPSTADVAARLLPVVGPDATSDR